MKRSSICVGLASALVGIVSTSAMAFPGADVITNDIPDVANHGAVGGC
jgi:hypothetical protein